MAVTLSIGAAALMLGVCVNTLRAWRASGFLVPVDRTEGGRRRYDPSDVAKVMQRDVTEKPRVTIAYARVSTHDHRPFGPPFRRDGHRKAGSSRQLS
jgi:predicted site-specific integrase-resolvase